MQANGKKSRWYLTFLPNGAAEDEEDTDHDDHEDDSDITIHGDVAVYLYQVSAYEHYVNSLKFKISFVNQRTGEKMLVYDHGYGKYKFIRKYINIIFIEMKARSIVTTTVGAGAFVTSSSTMTISMMTHSPSFVR